MQKLLLLRHAKSSWKEEDLADLDRPLNKRGERDAPRVGKLIQEAELNPDLVLCSPARRTRDTLQAMLLHWEDWPAVLYPQELYEATAETIRQVIDAHAEQAETLLVLGHNPGLEELLAELSGEFKRFPTAALAWLEFDAGWTHHSKAELRGLWYPRDLEQD